MLSAAPTVGVVGVVLNQVFIWPQVVLAHRQQRALALGVAAVGLVGAVALAGLAGHAVLGALAVVSAAVVNLPQMARALRDRQRLAGVSVPTYLLIATASACWLTYGVLQHDPLISAPHLLLLPSALVVAFLAHRSRSHPRESGPPAT